MSPLPLHVSVGKYTPRANLIEVTEFHATDLNDGRNAVCRFTLDGLASSSLARRHRLRTASGVTVDLDVRPCGKCFDLAWRENGAMKMRGTGIPDPQSPGSILAGWWATEPKVTGIVKYMISSEEAETVRCVCTSEAMEMADDHGTLGGRATGDTSNGFSGRYEIIYEGLNGQNHGPFAWNILDR